MFVVRDIEISNPWRFSVINNAADQDRPPNSNRVQLDLQQPVRECLKKEQFRGVKSLRQGGEAQFSSCSYDL